MGDGKFERLSSNTHEAWTLFAVRLHDKPGSAELRKQLLPAHLAWVAANKSCLRVAGSLRESPDSIPVGGLWVVRAKTKADVEALIASDPFTLEGLRDRWEILYWSKALPEAVSF